MQRAKPMRWYPTSGFYVKRSTQAAADTAMQGFTPFSTGKAVFAGNEEVFDD